MEVVQEPELICWRRATNNLQGKKVNNTSITERRLFFLLLDTSADTTPVLFFLKVGFECRMFPRIKYFILSLEEKDLSFPLLAFLSLSGSYLARCSDLVIHLLQCTFFFFFFLSLEYRLAASALARPRVTSSHFLNLLLRNVSQAFFFTLGCRCDLLTRHLLP